MNEINELGVLEGILFVVGDEGITLQNLCEIMKIDENHAKELLKELKEELNKSIHGIRISYLGDAFKLTTKQEHREFYQKLVMTPGTNKLSQAALETLAIIAYNQPITTSEVNEIRGVQSGQIIRKLVAKGLLKEAGKSDMVGRPNIYKTTSEFLDYFGLATIEDLPKVEVKNNEETETDLFTSIYKDAEEDASN